METQRLKPIRVQPIHRKYESNTLTKYINVGSHICLLLFTCYEHKNK